MRTLSFASYRLPSAIALALAAILAAWRMYALAAAELLWGTWPLILLLGAWGALVLLRQQKERVRLLGYATGAGLCLGIAFAPYGAIWSPVVGFALLLGLIDAGHRVGVTKLQLFWYAYHAMVVFNVVATWWVANTALAAGVVANFLNALFMATVVLLIAQTRRHLSSAWLLAAVSFWVGFEYLHFNWQIAWPWLCLGHTFAAVPVFAQWFSVTGVFGGSIYVASGGALLYRSIRVLRDARGGPVPQKGQLVTGAALSVPLLISAGMYLTQEEWTSATVTVSAVQPNFEPHYRKFAVLEQEQLGEFERLTQEALRQNPHLVVYPETSFGGIEEASLASEPFVGMWHDLLGERSTGERTPALLAGISSYRRYSRPVDHPALRTQTYADGTSIYYVAHNAAAAFDGSDPPRLYYKSKLVPGVEFLPYRKAMFFFEPLVASLGGTTAGLGTSDSAQVFRMKSGVVAAPLICYESIYGDYVRSFVQRGANLLVVPTNDGWWDDSPGYRQHFNFARLRAIETGRYVVQAANSGTSGFIDERGRAFAKTDYDTATTTTAEVRLLSHQTIFVRFGNVVGWLVAGAAVFVLLSLCVKWLSPKPRD